MNLKLFAIAIISVAISTGCATIEFTSNDIDFFQPEIVTTTAPDRPLNTYSLITQTAMARLSTVLPIIPSFNDKGMLLASWNPHPNGVKDRPTVVIVHGGHGLTTTDLATAVWARDELNANALVLDSFWSRGRQENWLTFTKYGANMRMLDSIAAAKWLIQQGVDKDKIFLMGGSQGGWTVLRTFTKNEFIESNAKRLYRAGISLYPVCNSRGTHDDPPLGPYWGPVIVFTGGQDTGTPISACPRKVFTDAFGWIHYPTGTHAWDIANRGTNSPPKDEECTYALNIYSRFRICRSNEVTFDMQKKIKSFVNDILMK